jgi:tRNA A-37 threonylcarbamoyl transferase component Bud32
VGRATAIAGAIAIVAGAAAIGFAVTRKAAGGMSEAQSAAMATAIGRLDGDIKAAREKIAERASTLSKQPVVRRAVETDAKTVADLAAGGELSFAPASGETVALGRIAKASQAFEGLHVEPVGATPMWHDGKPGHYAELSGEQIVITDVAEVAPFDSAPYTGVLSVTRPLALAPAIKALVDAGIMGEFALGGRTVAIGQMPAGAATHEHALSSPDGAKLIVAEPPPHAVMPLPALIVGIAVAALGLVLLVIGGTRRREPAASRAVAVSARPASAAPAPGAIGSAETQLSQHGVVASGTPSPLDPAGSQIVPSNLGAGAMIGRWEVVRRLGSGGMADVYLAQSKGEAGFEKAVAIKVMHNNLARNQRAVDHFLDEARLAARIHHPNVVAILDLGKIGSDYVIVMEYVEGVDLERLLTSARQGGRQVPIPVALGILCRICDGLDAAHRATSPDGTPLGIIHRDIKSANVLVSRQGIVKVVDFGIAKAASQVHFTFAGETKGTPSMMAPEQRVGEQVDVRADVYSVAAVGYELLIGQAVNLDLAALAHLGVDNWPHLPLPSTVRASLPHELDEILLGAMAFERDRRPPDCAAFEALCEAVIKTHNLAASDKDIARWVDSELRQLSPAYGGLPFDASKLPAV